LTEAKIEAGESTPMADGDRCPNPVTDEVWRWRSALDIEHAAEFHSCAVARMKPGQNGGLIMDLSEASHMDASGLQILVAIAVEALNQSRFFEISKASNSIERDLQLAGAGFLLPRSD
jgi:anti-anti-sigma factor